MQLRVGKIRICFGKHKRVKRAAEGCQNKDMLLEAQKSERAAEGCQNKDIGKHKRSVQLRKRLGSS